MSILHKLLIALVAVLSLHIAHGEFDFVPSDAWSGVPITTEATYECSFNNLWTEQMHPTDFPDAASWSDPMFVVHSEKFHVWKKGEKASDGVANFAKTGETIGLTVELLSTDDQVRDIEIGTNAGVLPFQANQVTPFMSTVVKMVPSPDWFTGFSSLDLRQELNDPNLPRVWYREFHVDTYPFTAGTLSGTTYSDPGSDVNEPIQQLTNTAVLANVPVARWSCQLETPSEFQKDENLFGGSVIVSAMESIEPTMVYTIDSSTINPSEYSTSSDVDVV